MVKKKEDLSLAARGLKYKLRISLCLMSVLPLLVCVYLVSTYIMPRVGLNLDIAVTIGLSIFIAFVGFLLIKEVFDRIVTVTSEARLIAAGDTGRRLDIKYKDEVGDLGESLNQLTNRIRSNMDELKKYGEKTTEINLGIQKRVIVLSSLLQISSLISQGARLEDILRLINEKSLLLANSDVAYLLFQDEGDKIFYMKTASGANAEYLNKVTVHPEEQIFSKLIKGNIPLTLDKQHGIEENLFSSFYEKFKIKNTLALPIFLVDKVVAILGIGNSAADFVYKKEDAELLDIFAKQISIAVENDILMHRVEKLEVRDTLTGLFNAKFIQGRLQEEIERAVVYRRSCAFVLLDIDNFKEFHHNFGSLQAESVLKGIAFLIKDTVSEIDRIGRIGDDEFSVILPEKNKRQAQETAEEIRKKIEFSFSEEVDTRRRVTVSLGVSENPLDGITAEELTACAKNLVQLAKSQGRNRVVSTA